MHANPSSLDTQALATCLRASAGEERDRQVDFLRYLDPFDAYKTDEETKHLVAALQPRRAPKEGIRKLPEPAARLSAPRAPAASGDRVEAPRAETEAPPDAPAVEPEPFALAPPVRFPSRPSLEPISADQWSLRATIDGAFKEELETLACLLSHKIRDGNLAAVLREAVRCAIEKHGKRRGAVKPARTRKPAAPKPRRPGEREPIPAEVRRAVWERDGGRCTYLSPEGRRCECRWQLELDHVRPDALGGPPTVENLRLRCRVHNFLHAEETFGRAHMARFRRAGRMESRTGESALAGESGLRVTSAAAPPNTQPRGS